MPGLHWELVLVSLLLIAQAISAAGTGQGRPGQRQVDRAPFGRSAEGAPVEMFTLTNAKGVQVSAISYGGIITSIRVPDRHGSMADIALGFDTLDGYLTRHPYFGAIVGRYGNRIAGARFTLDGQTYQLAANNGPNHLHGGVRGFDAHVWTGEPTTDGTGVVFSRTSPDGEEGYPGTVEARVAYRLTDANELIVEYEARTDKATPINLTQHSYFNLGGHSAGAVLDHEITIHADRFTPVDATLIPTGELAPVEGTPFDFRRPSPIGARIGEAHPQLKLAGGYDHNFVLRRAAEGLQPAARVMHRKSGRTLEVATTEPGLQFYTGNFLDGSIRGKGGAVYQHRNGFCLETQHFPDSPNKPQFPSTILRPGDTYRSRTVFTFGTDR